MQDHIIGMPGEGVVPLFAGRAPDEILRQMAELYRSKNKEHGDNLPKVGKVMTILFPNGYPTPRTAEDYEMLHVVLLIIGKLTRWAGAASNEAAHDSALDMAVYSAILLSLMEKRNA